MDTDDWPEFKARLIVMEERIREVQSDLKEIVVVIQGPPKEDSIRGRLHKLEGDKAAATAATAAIEGAKLFQSQQSQRRFSRGEKLVGSVFAFLITASTMASTVYLLTHPPH